MKKSSIKIKPKFVRLKKCSQCGNETAVAKKTCDCGFVFQKKTVYGFQEIPVILTPERLRSFGRPVRKKPKLEDDNFIYNKSKFQKAKGVIYNVNEDSEEKLKNNDNEKKLELDVLNEPKKISKKGVGLCNISNLKDLEKARVLDVSDESNSSISTNVSSSNESVKKKEDSLEETAKTILQKTSARTKSNRNIEKLYPIRNRSKLEKPFEIIHGIKSSPKLHHTTVKIKKDEKLINVINKNNNTEDSTGSTSSEITNDKDNRPTNENAIGNDINDKDQTKSKEPNVEEEISDTDNKMKIFAPDDFSCEAKSKEPKLEEELSETDNKMKIFAPYDFSYLSTSPFIRLNPAIHNLLVDDNVNKSIDVMSIKTDETKNWHKMMINSNQSSFSKRVESINCNVDRKIPNKSMVNLIKQKAANAKKKAILTSASKKSQIVVVGKRPVGRPRIHFRDLNKPKNPVGRPRKHPFPIKTKHQRKVDISRLEEQRKRSEKLERFSKIAAVAELAEDDSCASRESFESEGDKKIISFQKKRGRPKGVKDSKPRKIRYDYINRMRYQNDMLKSTSIPSRQGRCFLSPPSLMASAKKERIKSEVLDSAEDERIARRMNRIKPYVIPAEKREIFSLILDEINRRIQSQSFCKRLHNLQ